MAPASENALIVQSEGSVLLDVHAPRAAEARAAGTFGSRQEEAQRLGRILRPKRDGRAAHFFKVRRGTIEVGTEEARRGNRNRFRA